MSLGKVYEVILSGISPEVRRELMLLLLVAAFTLHVAWACGYLPRLPGFALAADVQELVSAVGRIEDSLITDRIDRLESEIRNLHMLRCYASNSTRQLYAQMLDAKLVRYRRLTQNQLTLPPCADL